MGAGVGIITTYAGDIAIRLGASGVEKYVRETLFICLCRKRRGKKRRSNFHCSPFEISFADDGTKAKSSVSY